VIRNLLLVAVATVVTVAALRSAGFGISVLVVVARSSRYGCSCSRSPRSRRRRCPVPSMRRNTADDEGLYHWTGSDSLRAAVRRWEQRLEWSQSDPASFSRNVLPCSPSSPTNACGCATASPAPRIRAGPGSCSASRCG
jgi:hypothetical protein